MFLPDALLGQLPGEEAHIQSQQQTLFPGHAGVYPELYLCCKRARVVGWRHHPILAWQLPDSGGAPPLQLPDYAITRLPKWN
jgi:hypothetical protein